MSKTKGDPLYLPEDILPAGVDVTLCTNPYTGESGEARKGTVAATIHNIVLLNDILNQNPFCQDSRVAEICQAISALIPSLRVIGIFNFFTPLEWLVSLHQPGRVLTTLLYLIQYPHEVTVEIKNQLVHLQRNTPILEIKEKIQSLLNILPSPLI
jgi:hypothetical protein